MADRASLTERELEVFRVYCDSDTAEEAADRLGVSRWTITNTVKAVLRKTDTVSARQAAYRIWGRRLAA